MRPVPPDGMNDASPASPGAFAPTRSLQARVLALLLLAYVFNFLDRQILAILKIPIWVAYVPAVLSLVLLVVACLITMTESWRALRRG